MSVFEMYLLFCVVPGIGVAFVILGMIGIFTFGCWFAALVSNDYGEDKKLIRKLKYAIVTCTIAVCIGAIMPEESDVIKLFVADKVMHNKDLQNIPGYIAKLIEKQTGG